MIKLEGSRPWEKKVPLGSGARSVLHHGRNPRWPRGMSPPTVSLVSSGGHFILASRSPPDPPPLRTAGLERGVRFSLTTSQLSPYVSFAL